MNESIEEGLEANLKIDVILLSQGLPCTATAAQTKAPDQIGNVSIVSVTSGR
jgi:hypothetical protein